MRRMIQDGDEPESLEMGDVLGHARLLVVHLVPHRLQLTREGFLNFGALQTVKVRVFQFCLFNTHILELAGEPLVLLSELGDQEAFLLLRRPLAVLRLLQQGSQALDNRNLTLLMNELQFAEILS